MKKSNTVLLGESKIARYSEGRYWGGGGGIGGRGLQKRGKEWWHGNLEDTVYEAVFFILSYINIVLFF